MYILNIDNSKTKLLEQMQFINFSVDRIVICFIFLGIGLNYLLCAIVNYLICCNGLSDLNCNYLDKNDLREIATLGKLTVCFCGLAFGIAT